MKIKDVVVENTVNEAPQVKAALGNLGSKLKAGVQKAAQGGGSLLQKAKDYQQLRNIKAQQKAGQDVAQKSADVTIQHWNQIVGQKQAAGQEPTVDDLKMFMSQQTPTSTVPAPADLSDPLAVQKYINQSVAQHIANRKVAGGTSSPSPKAAELAKLRKEVEAERWKERLRADMQKTDDKTSQIAQALIKKGVVPTTQQPAQQSSNIIVPPQVGGGPRQTAPATTAPAQDNAAVEKQALAQGVKVISQEPIIIQFKNKEFGLNDNGDWVHIASGKIPPESLRAFLSQQHDISLG